MESALISRIYSPPTPVSTWTHKSHRVQIIPLTRLEFLKVFLRFQLGRATGEDIIRYRYMPGWTAGTFVDVNNIEIGEGME